MSKILSTVGNYTITEEDLDAFISSLSKEQQMYRTIPEFRRDVQIRLEEISLFAMLGEETKVEETDEYKEAMKNAKRDIAGQIAMKNLLKDIDVTDEEVKEFFDKNPNAFAKGPSASAKHILVDTEEQANSIKAEIENGDKTFEDAAKEYSSCPSSAKGGSLGTFGRGQMVPEFDEAVFTEEVKKVIGPVQTQFGYHLIYIDERNDGEMPEFEDVKTKVRSQLMQLNQKVVYDNTLAELRKKYVTKIEE